MNAGGPLDSRWFDGQSPKARPVTLRINGDELVVQMRDDAAQTERHYAMRKVRWPERRTHGQRQAELPDGGLIQHADATEWDAWWQASGQRDSVVVGWMQSWRATLVALVGTVVFLAASWVWGVPWLSQTVAHQIPASLDTHIGRQSLQQIDRLFLKPSVLPQQQQDDLRRRFKAVVDNAYPQGDAPAWTLAFHASSTLGANAFALPGGFMVITDDLVALLNDQPDAIVGVLAHEHGHVQNRDGLDMLVRASLVSALVGVVLGDASGFLATVPATLATQAYSRDAERRADAHAARLLHRSGISPSVMVVFFERMLEEGSEPDARGEDKSGKSGKRDGGDEDGGAERSVSLPIAIGSHPDHEERIRYFREWQPDGAP
ncbi:M48 family metallopeptidase [Hydrogenophaga sp.]|uniref:M48 family metallopeptidase n=1 Tax=Hydrogenophaga sp. TaxID=1904254 RepID=UPI00272366A9|nr:M48 family metallopeptidase [Hydrogenophaga sp.]MDO9434251.1 M48 family metallopeptidase [Hydrogenophaga sp.]